MNSAPKETVHGTAVALQVHGTTLSAVLLRGKSGTGKSDLAFRLIETGGVLIGDDQVVLERQREKITVSAPESIRGLLEVRGVGLLKYPTAPPTQLRLVVDLVPREDVPRLPQWTTLDILGVAVTWLQLYAFDASTPFKITKAIDLVHKPDLLVR